MIKRYDLSVHCAEQGLLVHAALGDFIRYADHAAFVARVREIARSVSHHPDCTWHHTEFCNCARGKLLALCEVK